MEKKNSFKISTGASSIIMIFVVLCLTTFAVLSYVTANADYKMTENANDTIKSYYAAEAKAQKVISEIDEKLVLLRDCANSAVEEGVTATALTQLNLKEAVLLEIKSVIETETSDINTETIKKEKIYYILTANYVFDISSGADIAIKLDNDGVTVLSFAENASDTHQLEVALTMSYAESGTQNLYKVTANKYVSTIEWPESTYDLIGEEELGLAAP